MAFLEIDDETKIHYIHREAKPGQATFVFANSMGASTATWEPNITRLLAQAGFGTLCFDYRGQGKTVYGETATLTPNEIIGDIGAVLKHFAPPHPILVGLSIGGLFAMRAHLEGSPVGGIALINTLRKPGVLVEWIAELEIRLIRMGGMPLVLDAIMPVLAGKERLAELRPESLSDASYIPQPENAPRLRLAKGVPTADWDVPYEDIKVPVLNFSGQQDRLFRVPEDVEEICNRIPDCQHVIIPNAGHALPAEATDEFLAELIAFGGSTSTSGA